MSQAKLVNGNSIGSVRDWVRQHNSDYGAVRDRLEFVRNVVLHGRLGCAADILKTAYVFSVMSQRTALHRHERAFTAYYAGEVSLKDAFLKTVYGGQKYGWCERTMESTDWENLAIVVRSHVRNNNYAELLDQIDENLVGVAHRKGAFMLAMSGLYEYMCIDSNVARYGGYEESKDGNSLEFDNGREYMAACEDISEKASVSGYVPPFIVQWAIYDFERGEHARHMAYFSEVLPHL